ncbi:hypothetical protein KP509_14G010700 [Ceratopteris richardii]|uniref:HAT C-terminal dimerisation domain-containing protein n=1 Tax=Ceratopteris richardii TaxID=49495 RepID=A0A8T2T7V7_CERRI|nr:hypothetical protein KP509_14G010700 [Ceratopteris richardii]
MSQRTLFDAFKKVVNKNELEIPKTSMHTRNEMMYALFGSDDEVDVNETDNMHTEVLDLDLNNALAGENANTSMHCIESVHNYDSLHENRDDENIVVVKSPLHNGSTSFGTQASEAKVKKMRKYNSTWEIEFPFLKLVVDGREDHNERSLIIDESSDRALEKHLIVYASFLNKDGLGVSKSEFFKLIVVADGYAQTKYNAIMNMLFEMSLDIKNLVGISRDGDRSMLGCHEGLVSKLTLALVDACKCFPYLSYVDKIANKVYSWINASNVRHLDFQKWLARGNVMVRLVKLLPAILTFWKCQVPMWYEKLCIFKVLFCIHLLTDVLLELDRLNRIFQKESIDITSFSTSIEVCLNSLKKKFIGDIFAKGTIYLKLLIENAQMGRLKHVNENGEEYTHTLLYVSMPGKDKNGFPLDIQDVTLNTCIEMAKDFVLKYPSEEDERERKAIIWLSRLLTRIGNHVINANGCEKEVKAFVDTLYYGCEGMNFKDAWRVFSNISHWQEAFPNILKLWQILLVLPISRVPCERGFSKQNIIKTDRRQHLKVDTLDMLM